MFHRFQELFVILSAAKDPQLLAASLEARILRSFLPQDDNAS
jgi:hypothetical protein